MSNVTLAIDDKLLEAARAYAHDHDTTVNALVRKLLEQAVQYQAGNWADEFIAYAKEHPGNSQGQRWTKDEINERPWSKNLGKKPRPL